MSSFLTDDDLRKRIYKVLEQFDVEVTDATIMEVIKHLRRRNKVPAVQAVLHETKSGLKVSKDIVDAILECL